MKFQMLLSSAALALLQFSSVASAADMCGQWYVYAIWDSSRRALLIQKLPGTRSPLGHTFSTTTCGDEMLPHPDRSAQDSIVPLETRLPGIPHGHGAVVHSTFLSFTPPCQSRNVDTNLSSNVKSFANANLVFTPKRLSSVRSIPSTVKFSYTGSNMVSNVAYDIFLNPTAGNSGAQAYEVMIWLAAYGGAGPISADGNPVATTTLAGTQWKLYDVCGPDDSK